MRKQQKHRAPDLIRGLFAHPFRPVSCEVPGQARDGVERT